MSLSRALRLVNKAGRLACEAGIESSGNAEDLLISAIEQLKSAKQTLIEAIYKEEREQERRYREAYHQYLRAKRDANDTRDRETLSGGSGMAGRDEGAVQVPGAPQAHDEKPQK